MLGGDGEIAHTEILRHTVALFQIGLTIVDDNQWEPDEEFFVKLTLIPGSESETVKLGKTCIMEITILNDDGTFRSIEVEIHV